GGHVADVHSYDPEQTFAFRTIPRSKTCAGHRLLWEIDLQLQLVLERDRVIANYVQSSGLDRARLDSHSLSSEIQNHAVDQSRFVSFVALIDDSESERQRLCWRRNLPLVSNRFNVHRHLHRSHKLAAVVRAVDAVVAV